MITQNEISSLNLSPTKKDFVQIWNELIEVASKITERWDPTSTNESDPGIVLLKVLTGIADKLNYNIDKNILEAYMPTAAQMESMRKLCELVGYDIKYYQSAETKVRISYTGNTTDLSDDNEEKLPVTGLALPKFTTITNADKDITFVTTNAYPVLFTNETPWVEVPCIEGQISQCESTNDNNLINLSQLDDNNRYYLPEIQIAENGIFVYNATASLTDGDHWTQVSNLNTQPSGIRVYKFGYDSLEGRPYLAFPDDIGSLIEDGLFIYFVRTSGLSGNISPRALEVIEIPTGEDWKDFSAEQFEVVNKDATTNGANIESISAAYNSFKRTVGTFDTLVTCRDYMNKIYSLMDANNYPYVSNILVTDIRNDINNAITLCSCNEFGILYKETPLIKNILETPSVMTVEKVDDGNDNIVNQLTIKQSGMVEIPMLDHFDLLLYPFKTFTQVSSGTKDLVTPYNRSFTYTEQMNKEIDASLAEFKTCAHNLTAPAEGDVVSINNYLRLNALIATSNRVSEVEAEAIIHNIKVALVNEFNLRNLDFGEEIPFDSILSVIENADSRIKVVSLQEPTVLTTYSVKEREGDGYTSKEYGIASAADIEADLKDETNDNTIYGVTYKEELDELDENGNKKVAYCKTAKEIYNKLVLRNILAGRASLFEYDETFVSNNSEKPYTIIEDITAKLTAELEVAKDAAIAELVKKATDAFDISGKDSAEYTYEYVLPVNGTRGSATLKLVINATKDNNGKLSIDVGTPEVYETYQPLPLVNTSIEDIARIEAICEISSTTNTFKNITLGKNEVIKFRAPNLITTKTFPAYVYYRFERGTNISATSSLDGTDGSYTETTSDGSYAETMSLTSFINAVNGNIFFPDLWQSASKLNTFTANIKKDSEGVIDQSNQLTTIFNTAIAVGTKIGTNYRVFTNPTSFYTYLDEIKTELTENEEKSIIFEYYPLNMGTINTWSSCVRNHYTKKYGTALPEGTILWRLSSTSGYSKGRLITEAGQKLYAQSSEYLVNIHVGDTTYIATSLGADPVFYSISKDSDVELRPGDKLYIHYTPSSTNEDGETVNAEPISIVYEGGNSEDPVIIKPSGFDLIPSDDVNKQGTSWKKTDVEFVGHGKKNLLALAPNEQIELRSISKVSLSSPARLYKNFDNEELEQGSSDHEITYELKDGEYLFYTDQNTQEAAYYGSGSVITLDKEAYIPKATEPVEISQILEQGLHVVPWSYEVPLSPNRKITITEYQYTSLVEGDTLNTLTVDPAAGTTISNAKWLKCLSTADNPITYTPAGAENPTKLPSIELISGQSASWEVCSFLELSTSPGYSQSLRAAEIPQAGSDDAVLLTNKVTIYTDTGTGISTPIEIVPQKTVIPASGGTETFEPVSFKLNTIAQVASGNFEKAKNKDNNKEATANKLQMKVFSEEAPLLLELKDLNTPITPISVKAAGGESALVNSTTPAIPTNINNHWSAIDIISKLSPATQPKALNLNFMIPDQDRFGLFSIYLETSDDMLDSESNQNMLKKGSRVFIDIPSEFGSCAEVISIFNYKNTVRENTYTWWSDGVDKEIPNRLYLRAGLNCIRIAKSCSILIKAEAEANGTIIYDNMRLVKGVEKHGINLELINFKAATDLATDKQLAEDLLANIAALDKKHEFYYNVPIENSLAIEFDKNISSFSNPYTLYDVNNVNNDFVVSKLDIKYLDDGLKIAKSSKY